MNHIATKWTESTSTCNLCVVLVKAKYCGRRVCSHGKASGTELEQLWSVIIESDKLELVKSVVQIEALLANLHFTKYGSLYFALSGLTQDKSEIIRGMPEEISKRFTIGKNIERDFWAAERSSMELDRGPCMASSYIERHVI